MTDRFIISELFDPFIEREEREESGFRLERKFILEYPHDQFNDEFLCTFVGENALLPLKEQEIIEATLSFHVENNGVDCQTIYVTDVKKFD